MHRVAAKYEELARAIFEPGSRVGVDQTDRAGSISKVKMAWRLDRQQ